MRLRRLLAAALVALATGAAGFGVAPSATAASGYCAGAGVNVVVDFTDQGGGVVEGCAVHGAGGSAWNAFQQAGFPLTGVQRYPGAVCRVSGRPADAPCQDMPPADAYWGFFTSHGSGWTYATVGPSSYRVANGDTVGFAWQTGPHRAPGAAPAAPHSAPSAPAATPTSRPAPAHSGTAPSGTGHGGTGHHGRTSGATTPAAATPSASATGASTPSAHATATTTARVRSVPTAVRRHGTTCADHGVDVVVDFHQLGGGIRLGCAPDAHTAWQAFTAAGVRLTELQKFAGAICRVDGRPAGAACVGMPPADAYWSLYVPKGSGHWTYATKGAKALTVHDGDVVALSWQGSKQAAPPRLTPAAAVQARPSVPMASASASTAATAPVAEQSRQVDQGRSGVPWWAAVIALVVLGGAGGALAWRRRTALR